MFRRDAILAEMRIMMRDRFPIVAACIICVGLLIFSLFKFDERDTTFSAKLYDSLTKYLPQRNCDTNKTSLPKKISSGKSLESQQVFGLFKLEWIPYLKDIYANTFYNKAYEGTGIGNCIVVNGSTYTHNYTKPLLTCTSDLPKYDKIKNITREQIKIWCKDDAVFSSLETVPVKARFQTIGQTNESRNCLHNFINQNCYDEYPIPNIVHWVYYGSGKFDQLWKAMAFYSVVSIAKPCLFIMHGSHPDPEAYWDAISPFGQNVVFVPSEPHKFTTRGKKIVNIANQADIARLEALEEFGGVYLDTDVTVLKPFDIFRSVSFAAFREGDYNGLTNAVMFSRKNHPFSRKWLKNWDSYDGISWSSHSIHYLTQKAFNTPNNDDVQAFGPMFHPIGYDSTHRLDYTIRLYKQPCSILDAFGQMLYHLNYPNGADIEYIKTANTTFGIIARYLFLNDGEICKTSVKKT